MTSVSPWPLKIRRVSRGDHGGGSGVNVAAQEDEVAQEDGAAQEDGGLAESGVTEGLGEGGDDKAWNPDGEDEPRGVQEFE